MIEQGLFKRHFVGRDGFHWWIGQIVGDKPWIENMGGSSTKTPDRKGFGYRYQVRIMGYHTADDKALPNSQLPWAHVMYPVTAGGADGAALETPQLSSGNFVYGFFVDGEDAQQPVIIGIIGYNNIANNDIKTIYSDDDYFAPFTPVHNFSRNTVTGSIANAHSGTVATFNVQAQPPKPQSEEPNENNDGIDPESPAVESLPPPPPLPPVNGGDNDPLNFNVAINLGEIGIGTHYKPFEVEWVTGQPNVWNNNVAKELTFNFNMEWMPIAKPQRCTGKKSPGKIQREIQKTIQDLQEAKKGLASAAAWVKSPIVLDGQRVSVEQYVDIQLNKLTKMVTDWMALQIEWIWENVERNINEAAYNLYNLFNPALRQSKKELVDTAMDLLSCHFRKILKNLFNIVRKALLQVVDRYINVPLCAAENIIASILGKLTGLLNGIVGAVMGPINAALGAFDIAGDIIDYVIKILSFLQCEEDLPCDTVDAYSFWQGNSPPVSFDINSLIEKIKGFASGVSQSVDPDNFDFDLDFSDIMDNVCNVDAILCGPPEVNIWGGGGSGATGNAVVSAAGDILGIDITNAGSGYTKEPFLTLEDACGKGHGGTGRPVIGPVSPITEDNIYIATISNSGQDPRTTTDYWVIIEDTSSDDIVETSVRWHPETIYDEGDVVQVISTTTTYIPDDDGEYTGVTGIVITEPGSGYIGSPDGDLGGDGRVWATADQTIIKRSDDTWDIPYWPGDLISVGIGDEITTPNGTLTEIVCYSGDTKVVYGGTTHTVGCNGVISAPSTRSTAARSATYPLSNSKYPVILYICGVFIGNGGFGYKEGDEIVLEPSMGAVLEPVFSPMGVLIDVKIINGGEGFKEQPRIYIKSDTGINATLAPRFCIDRIGDDDMKQPDYQDKLVSVIDCVGTVPPVKNVLSVS